MVNRNLWRGAVLLLSGCALGGCFNQALVYSRTTQPLMTDFRATPVVNSGSQGDVKAVSFYVDVEWGDGGIGQIARRKGIGEIYYADIQTTSVLGYWKRDLVRVYGRPVAAVPNPAVVSQSAAEQGGGSAE